MIEKDWSFYKVNSRKDFVKVFEDYQMKEYMETLYK